MSERKKPCFQERIRTRLYDLSPEDKTFLSIIIVTILVYFMFLVLYSATTFLNFLTSFVAGILGILIGFGLDRKIEQIKNNRIKRDYLTLIHYELEEIKGKIYPQVKSVNMLYPEIWDSLISSGIIRLLSSEQVTKLSKVYRFIKGTQFEAEWVRRAIEEYNNVSLSERERKLWLLGRCTALRLRHDERGEKLSKQIEDILKEKWW